LSNVSIIRKIDFGYKKNGKSTSMSKYNRIIIKSGKEASLDRKHLWVFSGAIDSVEDTLQDADIVSVYSSKEKFLGTGYYSADSSIAVRILSFEDVAIDVQFYIQRLAEAWVVRSTVRTDHTNTFRWIHAEGDGLPGLIVDFYNHHAVIQAHSPTMHTHRSLIAEAIQTVVPSINTIYYKPVVNKNDKNILPEYLYGSAPNTSVLENGNIFEVNWVEGQKTGFFIDQRDNRALLQTICKGKSVLNTFCYSGGFSVYALAGGASSVTSVDSSATAMALTDQNIALQPNPENHTSVCEDVFNFMRDNEDKYDIVILDPPAFAKSQNARHSAIQAYKRLNKEGLKKVKKGGYLMTYSCSQVVDKEIFAKTIYSAALESGRSIRILKNLEQTPCHPVNMYHPEGHYLKGLWLYVE
jgi:23S rRNA (cytosine1962-C5)-methyltransferase